jgi:Porin PorA
MAGAPEPGRPGLLSRTLPGGVPFGRVLAPVLLASGAFALALAVLLPMVVYPRLAVFPADPQALQAQVDASGSALVPDLSAPAGARVLRNVEITIDNFISQAPEIPDDDSVVWQVATTVQVAGKLLNARYEHVSIDKRTGLTNNCCGDRLFTTRGDTVGEPLQHSGYLSFPFNVQKKTYRLWDVQLRRSRPATYLGQDQRDGFSTYKFVAATPLTKIGTQDLPGSLFGLKDASVTADSMYADTRTFWVEPNTGSVVGLHDKLRQQFTYNGRTVIAIDADLSSPNLPETLRDQTRQGAMALPWLRGRASWVLVAAGLLMIYGWYAVRRRTY